MHSLSQRLLRSTAGGSVVVVKQNEFNKVHKVLQETFVNHTSFKIAAAALAVASALSSTAYAGGFQLTEQSALALGRAYAGVGVMVRTFPACTTTLQR